MNSNSKFLSYLPAITAVIALALLPFSFYLGVSAIIAGGFLGIATNDYGRRQRPLVAIEATVPKPGRSNRGRLPLAA